MRLREGLPKEHMCQRHNTVLTQQLVENTNIIASSDSPNRLRILEALHIREKTPIDKQILSFAATLALWGGGASSVENVFTVTFY